MKINMYPMLKTLLFTLENGKSISSAMGLIAKTAKTRKERRIFTKVGNDLKDGLSFSDSLHKYKLGSLDIIYFIRLAEKGMSFKAALKKIIKYIEVKDEFQRESNDKTTLPFIYLTLASIGVIGVKFFAVPYQMQRAQEYSAEIIDLIATHLLLAQVMTNVLLFLLIGVISYFIILMLALFSDSYSSQAISKKLGLALPFIGNIIKRFEKFMLFGMLGEMMQSGISFKKAMESAIETTSIKSYKVALRNTLKSMKYDGKILFPKSLYDDMEKELMRAVGSSQQIGSVMLEMSNRARTDALALTTSFFRMIMVMSIFLMAFTVFIEFYTVVLTQILIQKGLIDLTGGIGAF